MSREQDAHDAATIPVIFPDVDDAEYLFNDEKVKVTKLTNKQLFRAYHKTFDRAGLISREMVRLDESHEEELELLEVISIEAELRGMSIHKKRNVVHVKKD